MRIIGDVHGKMDRYKNVIEDCNESVQVGDMNFEYSGLKDVDINHRFFKGNHDGYNVYDAHELGDYGVYKDMFFMRGARSIDRAYRTIGVDWFEAEELNIGQCMKAIGLYSATRPDIMLSHDCPQVVCKRLFGYEDRPITRQCLDEMFLVHQPKLWIFGHHHMSKDVVIKGTRFICLKELEWIDL